MQSNNDNLKVSNNNIMLSPRSNITQTLKRKRHSPSPVPNKHFSPSSNNKSNNANTNNTNNSNDSNNDNSSLNIDNAFTYPPTNFNPLNNKNMFTRLFNHSTCQLSHRKFTNIHNWSKFNNMTLIAHSDTHDSEANKLFDLNFLQKRSKIVEIVSAQDLIFSLTHSGVCSVFSRNSFIFNNIHSNKPNSNNNNNGSINNINNARGSFKKICFVNITADEVIRSLFYNRLASSLITVSVYRQDNFAALRCRTTPLSAFRNNTPNKSISLFEGESLNWPGFVEFDDVNKKVLTFSACDKVYKVWSLSNYELLYKIADPGIEEIKISPQIMLCVYRREVSHIPLKILNIETGAELRSIQHLLHRNKKIDFIEQFNEKLLVKQQGENLQIVDIKTNNIIEIDQQIFPTPSAFIFLYENQLFLTFLDRQVSVWNFQGELLTKFQEHELWFPDCNTNNIYINPQQDIIISYCREKDASKIGSINISHILTGKLIAKISKGEIINNNTDDEKIEFTPPPKGKRYPINLNNNNNNNTTNRQNNSNTNNNNNNNANNSSDSDDEELKVISDPLLDRNNITNNNNNSILNSTLSDTDTDMSINSMLHNVNRFSPLSNTTNTQSPVVIDHNVNISNNPNNYNVTTAIDLNNNNNNNNCDIDESQLNFDLQCELAESEQKASVKEALADITALFYNEEKHEIYTGNKQGHLHIWGLAI